MTRAESTHRKLEIEMKTYQLTEDQIDMIAEDTLLEIFPVDSESRRSADASHTAQWIESSENKTWDLPTYGKVYGTRIVMWTHTDEAAVADVTVVDAEVDTDEQVREYAEEIASGLGKLTEANE